MIIMISNTGMYIVSFLNYRRVTCVIHKIKFPKALIYCSKLNDIAKECQGPTFCAGFTQEVMV